MSEDDLGRGNSLNHVPVVKNIPGNDGEKDAVLREKD